LRRRLKARTGIQEKLQTELLEQYYDASQVSTFKTYPSFTAIHAI
jgi:hypothetical protein